MCKQHNPRKIDKCMKDFIKRLNVFIKEHYKIVACCCGHNKYSMTIVVCGHSDGVHYDFVSGIEIPRKKRFYKKDKQGYYYIPETINQN